MLEIALYEPKFEENVGTALRSAYLLGVDSISIINGSPKVIKQASNTPKVERHIPIIFYASWPEFHAQKDFVFAVEMDEMGTDLREFDHPWNAAYLFGNESRGIPKEICNQCAGVICIPAKKPYSYNLATAVSIVLYDRFAKEKP